MPHHSQQQQHQHQQQVSQQQRSSPVQQPATSNTSVAANASSSVLMIQSHHPSGPPPTSALPGASQGAPPQPRASPSLMMQHHHHHHHHHPGSGGGMPPHHHSEGAGAVSYAPSPTANVPMANMDYHHLHHATAMRSNSIPSHLPHHPSVHHHHQHQRHHSLGSSSTTSPHYISHFMPQPLHPPHHHQHPSAYHHPSAMAPAMQHHANSPPPPYANGPGAPWTTTPPMYQQHQNQHHHHVPVTPSTVGSNGMTMASTSPPPAMQKPSIYRASSARSTDTGESSFARSHHSYQSCASQSSATSSGNYISYTSHPSNMATVRSPVLPICRSPAVLATTMANGSSHELRTTERSESPTQLDATAAQRQSSFDSPRAIAASVLMLASSVPPKRSPPKTNNGEKPQNRSKMTTDSVPEKRQNEDKSPPSSPTMMVATEGNVPLKKRKRESPLMHLNQVSGDNSITAMRQSPASNSNKVGSGWHGVEKIRSAPPPSKSESYHVSPVSNGSPNTQTKHVLSANSGTSNSTKEDEDAAVTTTPPHAPSRPHSHRRLHQEGRRFHDHPHRRRMDDDEHHEDEEYEDGDEDEHHQRTPQSDNTSRTSSYDLKDGQALPDSAKISDPQDIRATPPTHVVIPHFPAVLHYVLTQSEYAGKVVQWLPHGQAWRIVRWNVLRSQVLPQWFPQLLSQDEASTTASGAANTTKDNHGVSKSNEGAAGSVDTFLWHVNAWGFEEIIDGPDVGAYAHVMFRRDLPHLCREMRFVPGTDKEEDDSATANTSTPTTAATSPTKSETSASKTAGDSHSILRVPSLASTTGTTETPSRRPSAPNNECMGEGQDDDDDDDDEDEEEADDEDNDNERNCKRKGSEVSGQTMPSTSVSSNPGLNYQHSPSWPGPMTAQMTNSGPVFVNYRPDEMVNRGDGWGCYPKTWVGGNPQAASSASVNGHPANVHSSRPDHDPAPGNALVSTAAPMTHGTPTRGMPPYSPIRIRSGRGAGRMGGAFHYHHHHPRNLILNTSASMDSPNNYSAHSSVATTCSSATSSPMSTRPSFPVSNRGKSRRVSLPMRNAASPSGMIMSSSSSSSGVVSRRAYGNDTPPLLVASSPSFAKCSGTSLLEMATTTGAGVAGTFQSVMTTTYVSSSSPVITDHGHDNATGAVSSNLRTTPRSVLRRKLPMTTGTTSCLATDTVNFDHNAVSSSAPSMSTSPSPKAA